MDTLAARLRDEVVTHRQRAVVWVSLSGIAERKLDQRLARLHLALDECV